MKDYREIEWEMKDALDEANYGQSLSAGQTFYDNLKGKNIITPNTLRHIAVGPYYVEITWGRSMSNKALYGVTVLNKDGSRTKLSECFGAPADVIDYVEQLKEDA